MRQMEDYELDYDVQELRLSEDLVYKVTTVANEALPLEMLLELQTRREEISGQRLWEGSLLLCAHLLEACGGSNRDGEQEQPELDLNGKAVLELGAGTGVVSMLAHGLGAVPVVVTDGDKRCVMMAEKNMKENNIPAEDAFVAVLRWGEEDSSAALCKALSEWKTTTPSATVIPHDGGILLGMLQPVPSSSELHKAPCIEERTTVHHHAQPAVPIDCASGTPFVGKKGVPPGEVVDKMTPMAARESSPRVLFDFILAGDVLYKHSLVEPFLGTVQEMLAPNGRMLLCHVPRAGVTYKIVEEAFERAGLSFAVLASGKNDREAGGGGTNEERDVGGVELCMDDARRARLYSVTRTR